MLVLQYIDSKVINIYSSYNIKSSSIAQALTVILEIGLTDTHLNIVA